MSDLQIPPHLLTYDEQDWLPQVEDSVRYRSLRARELWRMAQDRWGHEHGVWRAEFEQMQQAQQAAQQGRSHAQ